MGDLLDGCGIPGGEGVAHLVQLPGSAGPEQLDQFTDERGVAERVLGPAQVGHHRRVEHVVSRHGFSADWIGA